MTFKCPHCSRDFSHRTALRNHIKIHGSAIDNYLQEIENERNNIIIQNENEDDEEQQDDETYHLEDVEENLNQLDQQEKMVYNIEETNILDRETNMDIERESVEINVGKEKVNVEDVDIEDDDDDDGDDAEREMEDEEITQKGVGFELISVEYPPVAKIIDVTMSCKTNFPSEEFGNFMNLLVKWNLSDACSNEILQFSKSIARDDVVLPTSVKQGQKFLHQLVEPHLSFKKVAIMKYNNEIYYLHYRQIFDAVKELLSNNNILKHCVFKFTPLYYQNQRIYGEQFNVKWWEKTQKTLPNTANVLSIILYSDATTCDQLGKSSEHPVYLTLGNIPNWHRNKPDAKVLLCYLPMLKAKTNSEKRSRSFLLAKKALFQHAFDVIMHPLLSYKDRDFDLQTNNGDMWCFPHISTLLGDLPENATQTLTYSVNSNHPCHKCLISGEDLNNLRLSNNQIELRMPKMMKDILDQQLAYQYSIYNMNNIFWKYP
ncbi:hypothetical protein RhiirA5_383400 [Rhizophagus irregularis]|uniref:C2H2-type domain-containing protein n=2 Tax=Rhizophagus irregularis TaxID=588596 RepID=A0A2N0NX55_9GLOM|nr:hypothetical protein RhiirA5_383400 [Rhizophagus irregularis]